MLTLCCYVIMWIHLLLYRHVVHESKKSARRDSSGIEVVVVKSGSMIDVYEDDDGDYRGVISEPEMPGKPPLTRPPIRLITSSQHTGNYHL